jgi:hypothetical protein
MVKYNKKSMLREQQLKYAGAFYVKKHTFRNIKITNDSRGDNVSCFFTQQSQGTDHKKLDRILFDFFTYIKKEQKCYETVGGP